MPNLLKGFRGVNNGVDRDGDEGGSATLWCDVVVSCSILTNLTSSCPHLSTCPFLISLCVALCNNGCVVLVVKVERGLERERDERGDI